MKENNKILPDNIPADEDLLAYVQENLSAEQRYALELKMAENNFINDAVEGLEQIKDKQNIQDYVKDLNHQLRKQTHKKRVRKHKRKLKTQELIIIVAVVILILCAIGYIVISQIPATK